MCDRYNSKRAAKRNAGDGEAQDVRGGQVLLDETGALKSDLTDREDRHFRYSL